jgi:4-amino-4-deoxy-L-arabinose transferase-like glycosyltransferase
VNPRNTLRALLLASAVLLFVDLGGSSIWDANEAFYVETPRQMVLTGDYVSPSFNGQPRFNKPVLSYWVVAAFYHVFGVSVATERLAIAFGALLLVFATYVIGRTVANRDTGVVAALIIASAPRVMLWSRRIFIDIYFASFLAVALMGFVLARAYPEHRRRYLIVMYAGLGLAMLTKGPVALVLPGLVLGAFLLWTRRLGELKTLMVPAGLVIIIAIVAPWYVMDYQRYGWTHIYDFFIGENVGRYTETYGVQQRSPFFYVPVLLTDLLPWSLLLPAALVAAWRARADQMRLLIVWIAAFVGVFSLSSTKQDLYVFPIVPAVAVLIADLLVKSDTARALRATLVERLASAGALLTGVVLVLVGALAFWIMGVARLIPNLTQGAAVGVVLVVGGAAAIVVASRKRWSTLAVTLGVTAVVANWMLVLLVMRPFEQFKPVPPMSEWLRAHAAEATVVAHYRTVLPSMTYYLGRPIVEVFDLPGMLRLVDAGAPLYVLLRPGDYEELRAATQASLCVVDRRTLPVFDAKLKEILANQLPQIWLAGVNAPCQ